MGRPHDTIFMRIYNWENRKLTEGVAVEYSNRGNAFVALGDPDTPGPAHMITLHDKNPAQIQDGKLHDVFPFWVRPKDGDHFLVWAKPHEHLSDVEAVLIRVSTWSPTVYSGRGFWRTQMADTRTMLTGIKHYQATNGRKACASYGLVRLDPGETLRIRPEGADDHWAVTHERDRISSVPWDVYREKLRESHATEPGDVVCF